MSTKTPDNVREAFKGQKKIKLTANGEMVLEPLQEQANMQYCKILILITYCATLCLHKDCQAFVCLVRPVNGTASLLASKVVWCRTGEKNK